MNKNSDFGMVEMITVFQKCMTKNPQFPILSNFSLDFNFRLTDFCHNGPELPCAAGGRMAGLYAKKINKWLTGLLFLDKNIFSQMARVVRAAL